MSGKVAAKYSRAYWCDVAVLGMAFACFIQSGYGLVTGNVYTFLLCGMVGLYAAWYVRRLYNFWITMFCLWWIARKVRASLADMQDIVDEAKRRAREENENV